MSKPVRRLKSKKRAYVRPLKGVRWGPFPLRKLYHSSTSALSTKVDTNHGVVTLQGKARNGAEKDLVTKLVTDIKGVKNVKNQMTVVESK